jgi:hypothetical protein
LGNLFTKSHSMRTTPLFFGLFFLTHCSDPAVTPPRTDASTETSADVVIPVDAAPVVCSVRPSDYQPRAAMMSHDVWPVCRSDNNRFQPFTTDQINAEQRVINFELMNINPEPIRDAMGNMVAPARPMAFFDANRDPSREEFVGVAAYYASAGAMSGLVERFSRRPDEHYPQPQGVLINPATGEYNGRWCGTEANWMMARDYCVGPATLRPWMTSSLAAGSAGGMGVPMRVHAARIEATLLYLFYASIYKESLSCVSSVADCDSAWGYYTGGADRDAQTQRGLARYIRDADSETHQRVWDGLLAVHCWRELDGGLMTMPPVATNPMMRERAREQLDRALNRGMVLVTLARLRALASSLEATDMSRRAAAAAHQGFVDVVGPLFARALETWVPSRYADGIGRAGSAAVTGTIAALRRPALTAAEARLAADTLSTVFACP